jgi:hypothetical protein
MAGMIAPLRKRIDPRQDPRYAKVVGKLAADSKKVKQHPPASRKAREPAKAAKGPPDEKAAGARAKQVDKLDEAKTPKPKPATFLEVLKGEIAKAMPKTLGDTEKFMKGGGDSGMKDSLKGNVAQQKQEATGDLKKTSGETPSESGVQAKPVEPIPGEPAPPAPQVDAPAAMPAPATDAQVSLQASKDDVADKMKQEKLTDERLKKANDPRFTAVVAARDEVNKQADAGPAKYRAAEGAVLAKAAGAAVAVGKQGVALMLGVKGGSKAKILSRQEQQKKKEEQELKTFTDFVKTTFDQCKASVDKRLQLLEDQVNDLFDKGVEAAIANMKSYVEDELLKYKFKRYALMPWLWIKDQFLDLPDEVNRFYEQGRQRFTAQMNAVAALVAAVVESQLAAAKDEVKQAQAKIAAAQKALSPAVQSRATQVTAEFNDKFAELEQGIEDKKQSLAEGLAQKYKEAFDKAADAEKEIKDANKGLVAKAKEKIEGVLKALAEFKEKVLAVLKKGKDAVDLILQDPLGFLSNLLAAIKKGFGQFVDNIWTHLKAGFMKWLFGSLASMGIELPTDLTLPSILKLVLGVLGITYAKMREKAVKLIGERAVSLIEKAVEYIEALIKGGPAALWEKVKEDLGNLKEMVIDAIQDWLITTLIKKAVAKIVSMFNPVGAIIQAILTIYDVVVFVVEKAQQILEFVEAIVNSVYNIATGAIGGAANWIEKALANMVPLLIGFLAQLLGLGGISEKIKEFIKKIQAKVDKAIDKAIAKVVALVKKLFGKLKAGAKALLKWWKKKVAVSGGGESHTLLFQGEKNNAELMIHTKPEKPEVFIKDFVPESETKPIKEAMKAVDKAKKEVEKAQEKDPPDEAAIAKLDADLTTEMNKLGTLLAEKMDSAGDEGSEKKPVPVEYPKRRAAAYPYIYVGPRTTLYIDQDWLKAAAKASSPKKALAKNVSESETKKDTWTAWNWGVMVFRADGGPTQQLPDGGGECGLDPQFANLAPGKLLIYKKGGKTGGGGKINARFRPYGFRPGKAGMDGDHVMERQLGGPDLIANLWPLTAGENRSSGATVNTMKVTFGGKPMTVHDAQQKRRKKKDLPLHLLIKTTKVV